MQTESSQGATRLETMPGTTFSRLLLLLLLAMPAAMRAHFNFTINDGSVTVTAYNGTNNNVTVPDTIEGLPVTTIGSGAFLSSTGLTSVTIPDSVTRIGDAVFDRCSSLTNVVIPNSVNSIGNAAFRWCRSLGSISIPAAATNIGGGAFTGCDSLRVIEVDALNLTYSGVDGVLFDKSLVTLIRYPQSKPGSYVIPNGVTSIVGDAFGGCTALTGVSIPSSVTGIAEWAFNDCTSLTNVTLPASVAYIGSSTFSGCKNLRAIDVDALNPNYRSVDGVLLNESLNTVVKYPESKPGSYSIPNGVTNILGAFMGCTGLSTVTIPSSIDKVRSVEFYGCTNLIAIEVDTLNQSYSSVDGVLLNKNLDTLIKYPEARPGSYVIDDGVTTIENRAFSGCVGLTEVTIPGGVTNIGFLVFERCTSLTNVTIPDSVTRIESSAFELCTSLSSITIPNSVTSIESAAFLGCTSLRSITIPNSVRNLHSSALSGCTNLVAIEVEALNQDYSSVDGVLFNKNLDIILKYPPGRLGSYVIPNSVKSIGSGAFSGCTGLTEVAIPNSVTSVGTASFSGCNSLKAIMIPNGVVRIENSTFSGCSSLTSITIPLSVTSIGNRGFAKCTSLASVLFEGAAPSPDVAAFLDANMVNVYYVPGTAGWGPTFAGRPTVLWKPKVQTDDASFGLQTGRFGFNIAWASDQVVVVEVSGSLTNPSWIPAGTNTLVGGSSYFSDRELANWPQRFYRLRSP